jgi:hypothetical protein
MSLLLRPKNRREESRYKTLRKTNLVLIWNQLDWMEAKLFIYCPLLCCFFLLLCFLPAMFFNWLVFSHSFYLIDFRNWNLSSSLILKENFFSSDKWKNFFVRKKTNTNFPKSFETSKIKIKYMNEKEFIPLKDKQMEACFVLFLMKL